MDTDNEASKASNEASSRVVDAPPEYNELHDAATGLTAGTADATDDGRIAVNLDSKFAKAFAEFIDMPEEIVEPPPRYTTQLSWNLSMNIVLQVVGSRGDVQPFIALGNELQNSGHRVRIATHDVFETFVRDAGLEFFPIGGDPAELMAYMVKNPGLIPNMKTLRNGEIKGKRKMISEMLRGCWRSCIDPDPKSQDPFVANAIIANPVSFAHIHCAQALSIPLHMVFTMPWSPTRSFPHPLANIQNSSTDPKIANYLSYCLVQALTWQGLADVINDFRKSLDLRPLPTTEASFLAETLRIPHTYCWSPALVPKPSDWADHIDVSGFIFRDSPRYNPPAELANFLQAGTPPVYIGFGSIVVRQPEVLLGTVLEAIKQTGVRAIISKGWSELSSQDTEDNVFFLGDCPHEWLFQHVTAVVHHGGAGTTAAGLLNGRPTIVIPFFGDQPFWGERIAASGAGPAPIPHKKLTASNLAEAIKFCLTSEASAAAADIAEQMRAENGVQAAAASFHRHLYLQALRCDIIPTCPAVYDINLQSGKSIKVSAVVADILVKNEKVKAKQVKLYEANKIEIENRRWDPFSSATSSFLSMSYDMLSAVNDLWYEPYRIQKDAEDKARARARQNFSDQDPGESPSKAATVTKMVGASAMSVPKVHGAILKCFIVDASFAVTEGFRNTPRLYGEDVPDHAPMTDWKSGAVVGGKEFAKGLRTGLVDLAVQPYEGAKEDGVRGFLTGIGKGALGTVTKLGTAGLGLYAYPAQGIWMSIRDITHSATKKAILSARRVQDWHHTRKDRVDEAKVLKAFDALASKKDLA